MEWSGDRAIVLLFEAMFLLPPLPEIRACWSSTPRLLPLRSPSERRGDKTCLVVRRR